MMKTLIQLSRNIDRLIKLKMSQIFNYYYISHCELIHAFDSVADRSFCVRNCFVRLRFFFFVIHSVTDELFMCICQCMTDA